MAKVAKTKKHEVSIHSRAARRQSASQSSPPSSKSKSEPAKHNEHWLYSTRNAGIGKKIKAKQLSHAQRVRQSKAVERAERNMDVLEKKVADSRTKGKRVQARRKDWEELNGAVVRHQAASLELPTTLPQPETVMTGIEPGLITPTTASIPHEDQVSKERVGAEDILEVAIADGVPSNTTTVQEEADIIS